VEWATVSIGALLLGHTEGYTFLVAFEIKRYIKRYVKIHSKWAFLSIGAPLGNLEWIRLPKLLERKR
jgi:hypothetical protein